MANGDDEALVTRAMSGDKAAFAALVESHQDRLFNAIARVLGNTDDARDVVQDAFVHAFTKLSTFRRSSAFYTWLYRIAFNAAISSRRKRKPASLDASTNGHALLADPASPRPSARLETQERAAQVQAALAALPEEFRVVLVLRDIDDRTYEEIAEMLELPLGTVRSRIHRARQQMREQLIPVLQNEVQ